MTRADVERTHGFKLRVGRHWVALHVHDGVIHAIQDFCPHRGAPLSAGTITADGYVECMDHGWQYNLVTGAGREAYQGCIRRFHVEERADGELLVSAPAGDAGADEDPDDGPVWLNDPDLDD